MTDTYPLFAGGETLTAADLNLVREFLHDRDRLVARLTGFGISCGLTGAISGTGGGTSLTVTPGLAVDQRGEPLLLAGAATVALPPTASAGTFEFVDPGPGGFSVVLEQTEATEPAPDCGEADCAGHAELHTRGVALRVVPGRLTGPRFDFPTPAMLAAQPLTATATATQYTALKNTVAGWLDGPPALVDPSVTAAIRATTLSTSDAAGVKGYKAGWLNQVLFTTLDLLRCRALAAVPCDRTTSRPGVVLGWLHEVSGTWTWDCAYRHEWEPPTGLSRSLLGGACGDVCGLYVGQIAGVVAGYSPPTPPPSGGGGGVVVPGDFTICPAGWYRVGGSCVPFYAPVHVPDDWIEHWRPDPLGPVWNPGDLTYPWTIYATDEPGWMDTTVVDITPAVGATGVSVLEALTEVLTGAGAGTPNVQVIGPGESLPAGYSPAGGVSPHDTVVLSTDASGTVTGVGRVAVQVSARNVGTELPAASGRAQAALDATVEQGALITGMQGQVGGLVTAVGGLQEFQTGQTQWRATVDQTLGGLDRSIAEGVDKQLGTRFDEYQHRVSTLEGTVGVLVKTGPVGGIAVGKGTGATLVEFARTITAGLAEMPEAPAELREAVKVADRATGTLQKAIDGDRALGGATVELMGALRTAVKAAGIAPSVGGQLDAQLEAMQGLLG